MPSEHAPEGRVLPDFRTGPISHLDLTLYCGASGDHNEIHIDTVAARQAGLPDIIAPGMLSMAHMSRAVTHWFGLGSVRKLTARFTNPVAIGELVTYSGEITTTSVESGERHLHVRLEARGPDNRTVVLGEALVAPGICAGQ